jgi:hypothetical protein
MSSSLAHRAVRIGQALTLAALSTACGATGLDWVAEPETPPLAASREDGAVRPPLSAAAGVAPLAPVEEEPVAEARPRLSRTVTLGEIDVAPATPSAAAPPGSGVSVTINNYTSVTPGYGYGYASFGYARSQPSFSAGRPASGASRSSAAGPQAGQSWPSIADHGSSFPYRSAPASPWARTQ